MERLLDSITLEALHALVHDREHNGLAPDALESGLLALRESLPIIVADLVREYDNPKA